MTLNDISILLENIKFNSTDELFTGQLQCIVLHVAGRIL